MVTASQYKNTVKRCANIGKDTRPDDFLDPKLEGEEDNPTSKMTPNPISLTANLFAFAVVKWISTSLSLLQHMGCRTKILDKIFDNPGWWMRHVRSSQGK